MFSLSYRVIFLQQPEAAFLDFYEDFRWHRIKPSINIQPIITPTYQLFILLVAHFQATPF